MLTGTKSAEHGYGVPYCVSREERKCVALLETMIFDKSSRDSRGRFLDLFPVNSFLGDAILIPCELIPSILRERRGR